jgi:hypothetical protein
MTQHEMREALSYAYEPPANGDKAAFVVMRGRNKLVTIFTGIKANIVNELVTQAAQQPQPVLAAEGDEIEHVARAIYETTKSQDNLSRYWKEWGDLAEKYRTPYTARSKAAIAAMSPKPEQPIPQAERVERPYCDCDAWEKITNAKTDCAICTAVKITIPQAVLKQVVETLEWAKDRIYVATTLDSALESLKPYVDGDLSKAKGVDS